MKRLLLVIVIATLVSACGPVIEVAEDDSTAPTLSIVLVSASTLNAHYTDDDMMIDAVIDPERHFRVEPRSDSRKIQLIFHADDHESGIGRIQAQVEARFTCHARLVTGPEYAARSARINGLLVPPPPTDGTTHAGGALLVEFDYEDLWERGNCSRWGAIRDHNRGRLADIEFIYAGSAWNNATPESAQTEISGQFSAADGNVRIGN